MFLLGSKEFLSGDIVNLNTANVPFQAVKSSGDIVNGTQQMFLVKLYRIPFWRYCKITHPNVPVKAVKSSCLEIL